MPGCDGGKGPGDEEKQGAGAAISGVRRLERPREMGPKRPHPGASSNTTDLSDTCSLGCGAKRTKKCNQGTHSIMKTTCNKRE